MTLSPSFLRGTVIGTILSVGALAAVPALAYWGDPAARGPHFDQEQHEQMQAALENRDYDAWRALMEESGRNARVLDVVTGENFDTFAEMHERMLAGDREGAKQLGEELGLSGPMGMGMGMKMHGPGEGPGSGDCFGRGMGPKNLLGGLTDEQRTALQGAMQACHDDNEDDWLATQRCRLDVIETYSTNQ